MVKTSVYLSEDEVAALRSLSAATGHSQAELIREGVRRLTADRPAPRFSSRALGSGPAYSRPTPDEVEIHVRGGRGGAAAS